MSGSESLRSPKGSSPIRRLYDLILKSFNIKGKETNTLKQAKLDPPIATDPSGLHPAGLTLVNVPQGTLRSEAGYEFKVDAEAVNCVDVIRRDG